MKKKLRQLIKSHKTYFIIFFVALFLRLFMFNFASINPDEFHWHYRSEKYLEAYLKGDFKNTLQAPHPGSTLMFFTAVTFFILENTVSILTSHEKLGFFPYLPSTFPIIHFSFVFQIMVISSATITYLYYLISKLFNSKIALISTILLLSDFYILSHSRVLQMDMFLSSLLLLSIVLALSFYRFGKLLEMRLSIVFFTLAVVMKIYALMFGPILALIIAFSFKKHQYLTWDKIKYFLVSLIISLLIIIIILPSIVTNTLHTYDFMLSNITDSGIAGIGEGTEYFFTSFYQNGEPKLFYFITFLFKSSIPVFLAFFFIPYYMFKLRNKAKASWLLLILCGIYYVLMLTYPSKKEDRYILLTHLISIIAVSPIIYDFLSKIKPNFSKSIIGVFAIFWLYMFISFKGEYMGYYNPLLGGTHTAAKLVRVGWGEGTKDVVRFLNSLPDTENVVVSSWYPSSIAGDCICKVKPAFEGEQKSVDYIVFYINELQRNSEEGQFYKFFIPENIVYTSYVNGFPYAYVLKKDKITAFD